MQLLRNPFSESFIIATGGTTDTYSDGGTNYKSHKFTSSGTFTVTQVGDYGTVDALIVAGGGGGGKAQNNEGAGGGGAGGFRLNDSFVVTAQGYTVTIGAGSAGANSVLVPLLPQVVVVAVLGMLLAVVAVQVAGARKTQLPLLGVVLLVKEMMADLVIPQVLAVILLAAVVAKVQPVSQ